MKVKYEIDESYAILAIQHHIAYNGKNINDRITSKKKFIEAVNTYAEAYCRICVDDHESEYGQYLVEAQRIVSKYYS